MSIAIAAFAAALLVGLAATPAVRRVALSANFVDRPGMHKSHERPVAYLGGVAIVVATLFGAMAGEIPTRELALVVVLAVALGIAGLLDDDHLVSPKIRLGAQIAAALAATAAGIRIDGSGIHAMDFILTAVWIVAITNAVNFLDNMDGLSAGICGVTSMAAAVLAIGSGQFALASLAAAVGGACLAFIAFNAKPAAIFMGDTGSLFLGFLMAVIVVEVVPDSRPPDSFAIPALLLALPCLDIGTVVIGRLRRRMPVTVGGRNHLSHRLVRLGLTRGWAVAVLVAVQTFSSVMAVLAARRLIDTNTAVLLVAVALATLAAVTLRADVWAKPAVGFEPRIWRAALAVSGGVIALSAPAIGLLLSVRGEMARGAAATEQALEAVRAGDLATADERFALADRELRRAEGRVNSPLVSLGLPVPILNSNINGTRELLNTAQRLNDAARELVPLYAGNQVVLQDGRFDLQMLAGAAPAVQQARVELSRAEARLNNIQEPFLISPVADRVQTLRNAISGAHIAVERAELLRDRSRALLGADVARTYALVVLDANDPTPVGGMPVAWAPLGADGGKLSLGAFTTLSRRPIDDITFAEAAGGLLDRLGSASSFAGVIAVDERALAQLAQAVRVPLPPSIDASQLGAQTTRVFNALTSSTLSLTSLRNSLAPALASHELQMHLFDEPDRAVMRLAATDAGLPAIAMDALLVTTQSTTRQTNLAMRDAEYAITLDPSGDRTIVDATFNARLSGGINTEVALHSPLTAASAQINGVPAPVTTTPGDVLTRHSLRTDTQEAVLSVRLTGTVDSNDGWYSLQVLRPAATAPSIDMRLTVVPGWRVAEVRGLELEDDTAAGSVDRDTTIDVRLVPTGVRGWLWQLRHGGSR